MLVELCPWREKLSPAAQELFDDVNLQRVLGASTHIRIIGDIFMDIADCELESQAKFELLQGIASHFITTRGESSQAISNAIALMLRGVTDNSIEDVSVAIRSGVSAYRADASKALDKIKELLWTILEGKKNLFLFDYSSTVGAIADIGKAHGVEFCCYIPESRALDGGRPYVLQFLKSGHKVHFIPDSAMYHYIQKCDAAFIGSETFYPDGTCFNTIGSEMLGLLCKHFSIPLYVPTPMLKVDMRALDGYKKKPIIDDHRQRMAGNWKDEEKEGVNFICPELVAIPPEFISAFITEKGILPYWAMYSASVEYSKSLMKGD